jgi:hypothetical protein
VECEDGSTSAHAGRPLAPGQCCAIFVRFRQVVVGINRRESHNMRSEQSLTHRNDRCGRICVRPRVLPLMGSSPRQTSATPSSSLNWEFHMMKALVPSTSKSGRIGSFGSAHHPEIDVSLYLKSCSVTIHVRHARAIVSTHNAD